MGITFKEFQVAMETLGAEKIHQLDVAYKVSLPCFIVGETIFVHSGSDYVIQKTDKLSSKEIMYNAIKKLKEEYPREKNYCDNKIYTIKALFTIALMLEGRYDKDLVECLISQTYRVLHNGLMLKNDMLKHFKNNGIYKMNELYNVLLEYDNAMNPYGNNDIKLRDPGKYLDKIKVKIDYEIEKKSGSFYVNVSLINNNTKIGFVNNKNGWYYYISSWNDVSKGKDSGYTAISHYYNNGADGLPVDEIINLTYETNCKQSRVELAISVKTGLVLTSNNSEEKASVAKDQIDFMIMHIRRCINIAKSEILNYVIV